MIHTPEAIKGLLLMFRRARRVRQQGFHRYTGTPERICQQIIDDTYDKENRHYRVSDGHFRDFFVRDFAFFCEDLVALGYKKEVRSTIEYALRQFKEHGRVRTLIGPTGKVRDYPSYGPDSLALLLYAITHTGNTDLGKQYRAFLQGEADYFVRYVIDPKTHLPYAHKRFTCMRDHAKRKASCYDATMIAVVARECEALGIRFPYSAKQAKGRLVETYWNGTYFFDDLKKQNIVVGDANVYPFWTGVVKDRHMLSETIIAIRAAGLDMPFPLRYVSTFDKDREEANLHFLNWFAKDYETDSVWMHMGLAYVRILSTIDKVAARKHLSAYRKNIERYGTFLELYDRDGQPFHTYFYWTDEAMSWCAGYLRLAKQLRIR